MQKDYVAALETLDAAYKLDPNNSQSRFQRANVLIAMERYEVRWRPSGSPSLIATASACDFTLSSSRV